MERLCGMLQPLVRSRQQPYTNLRSQVTAWTLFAHLRYKVDASLQIFGPDSETTRVYPETRVFSLGGAEELYSPSRKYSLSKVELQRLRAYYVTALDRGAKNIGVGVYFAAFAFFECFTRLHTR